MIAAALLALVLVAIGLLVAIAVLVWLVVYLVRLRGEESCCEDCDDWMDIADVVSDEHAASLRVDDDDHYAEDYALLNRVAPGLEGFTPLEAETLQRNYLPMTDDERFRLDMAWRSIVEGADR